MIRSLFERDETGFQSGLQSCRLDLAEKAGFLSIESTKKVYPELGKKKYQEF